MLHFPYEFAVTFNWCDMNHICSCFIYTMWETLASMMGTAGSAKYLKVEVEVCKILWWIQG